MWLFGKSKRKNEIEALIDAYLATLLRVVECFEGAMTEFMRDNIVNDEFMRLETMIHRFESESDDKRRNIEHVMYSRGLLPQSRGDILSLLEAVDRLANQMENCVQILYVEDAGFPSQYNNRMKELVSLNCKAVEASVRLFRLFLSADIKEIPRSTAEIQQLESQSDYIERKLIYDFFRSSQIECCRRILLRDLVLHISGVADKAENFSDRVAIYSVKRVF